MKVQEKVNSAAARTFDPRAVGTQEFSLAWVEDNVFPPEKSICYHGDAALPCQISLLVFSGWLYWTILLIPFTSSGSFWINRVAAPHFYDILFCKKFPKSLERIYSPRQGSDATPLGSAQIYCGCKNMYWPMPPAGRLLKIAPLNIFKMSSLGLFLCISFHFVTLTHSSLVNSLTLIFSFARSWDLCLNGSHLYGKPEASDYFTHCIIIIIILMQCPEWDLFLSASVSVSVLLNLPTQPDCESDLMSVLMCLPWSNRPRCTQSLSPESLCLVLTGPRQQPNYFSFDKGVALLWPGTSGLLVFPHNGGTPTALH